MSADGGGDGRRLSATGNERKYLTLSRQMRHSHREPFEPLEEEVQGSRPRRPQRTYGIVVFGATGFTGKRVLVEMASAAPGIRWAAAGRSRAKVQAVLAEVGLVGIDVLEADTANRDSLVAMCAETQVLINCTGPFRFHGEQVVEACIAAETNYVDITGEPEFIERSELRFSRQAIHNNVNIVHCCGFDSVPADEGALFLSEQFGLCSAAESFLQLQADSSQGFSAHATTLECAVLGFKNAEGLKKVRKDLERQRGMEALPYIGPKLQVKDFYWEPKLEAYVAKFPGSDAMVVRKSCLFRSARLHIPQMQFAAYMVVGSWWNALRLGFHKSLIEGAITTECGTDLVLRHPSFFTAGTFSHQGPTETQMAATSFAIVTYGVGWEEKAAGEYAGDPDYQVVTRVSGPEPGYIATPIFVVAAAMTLLLDHDVLPYAGQVLTPAAAFEGTRYRQRLMARGIRFDILSKGPISQPAHE